MSTFDAANWYFSGQGVIMVGRRDPITGNPIGLRPVGNCPEMRLRVATTVVNHKGSQDGQRATDARLQTEVNVTCSITVENWNAKNLAEATRGSDDLIAAWHCRHRRCHGVPRSGVTSLRYIDVSAVVVKQAATPLTALHRRHRAVGLQAEPGRRFHHDERWHPDGLRRVRTVIAARPGWGSTDGDLHVRRAVFRVL